MMKMWEWEWEWEWKWKWNIKFEDIFPKSTSSLNITNTLLLTLSQNVSCHNYCPPCSNSHMSWRRLRVMATVPLPRVPTAQRVKLGPHHLSRPPQTCQAARPERLSKLGNKFGVHWLSTYPPDHPPCPLFTFSKVVGKLLQFRIDRASNPHCLQVIVHTISPLTTPTFAVVGTERERAR